MTLRSVPTAGRAASVAGGAEPRRRRPTWVHLDAGLAAAVVVGAGLRLWGLGAQSLWFDEWLTAEATSGGPGDLLHHVAHREGIPPTTFAVLWGWVRVAGDGEVSLRAVSALAGVATIPVAYAAARALHQPRAVARIAALLVAVNPTLVWYSQEARPYALLALTGALSLLTLARLADRERAGERPGEAPGGDAAPGTRDRPGGAGPPGEPGPPGDGAPDGVRGSPGDAAHTGDVRAASDAAPSGDAARTADAVSIGVRGRTGELAAWAAVSAVAVAVHYAAVFLVAAGALALLTGAVGGRRWPWRSVLLAVVPTAVVLAALAPVAARQHSHPANRLWITDFPLTTRLSDAAQGTLVGPSPPDGRLWLPAAAVVATAVVAAAVAQALGRPDPGRRVAAAVAGLGLAVVALAVLATAVGLDVVVARYLIVSLVPLAVAVAVLLAGPRVPRWAGGAGLAALVAVSLVAVVAVARDPYLQRADWRAVAEAHRSGPPDGSRLLVVNAHGDMAQPLLRYLPGARRLDGDEAVTVERIDVVAVRGGDGPCSTLVGRACGLVFLGAPLPRPVAAGLDRARPVRLGQFTVERYRTRRPLRVRAADVLAPADRPGALVLVTEG